MLRLHCNAPAGASLTQARRQPSVRRSAPFTTVTTGRTTCIHRSRQLAPQRQVRVRSFEGDAAQALKDAAALDETIDLMLSAKTKQELAQVVAQNIFSLDAKFWMRIATRSDSATDAADKAKLKGLADTVMVLVDAMVKQSEQKLTDSAGVLQRVLTAAADENGEWYLPLTEQQVKQLRQALEDNAQHLDEALLSNCFAWMKKCQDDRFDSMVLLLQKVLQLYAARALQTPETEGVEGFLNKVVWAEAEGWEPLIQQAAADGSVSEVEFMEALQRRMEGCVLGMAAGSYAQRVQAEYLKEIEGRGKKVFRDLAAAGASTSQPQ